MAEDIRENEMNSGVPVKMRGIDADGNSISPTLQEVADALPGAQKNDRGVNYSLPRPIVSIHKPTGGNETKTITLFKIEDIIRLILISLKYLLFRFTRITIAYPAGARFTMHQPVHSKVMSLMSNMDVFLI